MHNHTSVQTSKVLIGKQCGNVKSWITWTNFSYALRSIWIGSVITKGPTKTQVVRPLEMVQMSSPTGACKGEKFPGLGINMTT